MKLKTNLLIVALIGLTIGNPIKAQVEFVGYQMEFLPMSMKLLFGNRCMYQAIYKSDTLAYKVGDDSLFIFCPENGVVGSMYLIVDSKEANDKITAFCKAVYAESKVIPDLYYTKKEEDVWLYAAKVQDTKYYVYKFYRGFPILDVERRYKEDD